MDRAIATSGRCWTQRMLPFLSSKSYVDPLSAITLQYLNRPPFTSSNEESGHATTATIDRRTVAAVARPTDGDSRCACGLMPKFASPPRRSSRRAWLGTVRWRPSAARCDRRLDVDRGFLQRMRNRLGSVQGRVRPIARTATRELRNACIEVKPERARRYLANVKSLHTDFHVPCSLGSLILRIRGKRFRAELNFAAGLFR